MMSLEQRGRLQVVANEGPEALRRFLRRTRIIYNWRFSDVVAAE
jgi:hypothetical protein